MNTPRQIIDDIRCKLAELEDTMATKDMGRSVNPPKQRQIYNMFGDNGAEPVVEEVQEVQEEPAAPEGEETEPAYREISDLNLINEDNSSPDMALCDTILQCVSRANRLIGVSPENVSREIRVPKYRVSRVMREMFLNDDLEKVQLRPITYRTKSD